MTDRFYVGVDAGTGSARAGVFDDRGHMLAACSEPIRTWRPAEDFVEQSSDDIWKACASAVRQAVAEAAVDVAKVAGIGFDATCSLVVLDANFEPLTVSSTGSNEQNVIVWMDHRAVDQAERINATRHDVLRYVGGTISPEMEVPKLLWLREQLPATWRRAGRFFDLPDFLVWRATGSDVRSLCTTACKWTYLGHEGAGGWQDDFFDSVGLADLGAGGYDRIGSDVQPIGEAAGDGLTAAAARELGLPARTPAGVAIIDAHAGGVGLIGARIEGEATRLESRLALIGGTSSCHMAVAGNPRFIDGIWGPYWSAMVPGTWLTEGGQSATGALIDHVVFGHPRSAELGESKSEAFATLNARLDALAAGAPLATLTRDVHVLPYFHGNRSPRADPTLRGMISGLKLSDSLDHLAVLYLATVQAIAHGTRHIIETMNAAGFEIDTILACGGDTKNPVFVREHADVTGCRVVLAREPEAVLLGSAILGRTAAGDSPSVQAAMDVMSHAGEIVEPAGGETSAFHMRKHAVFERMYADQLTYRAMLASE